MRKLVMAASAVAFIDALCIALPVYAAEPTPPPTPLQLQVAEVQQQLDGYRRSLKTVQAQEMALQGLIPRYEAMLASLKAQQGIPQAHVPAPLPGIVSPHYLGQPSR